MKNNKVLRFGIALISTVVLGAVAPALTNNPIFSVTIVSANEQKSFDYIIYYYDRDTGEEIATRKIGVLKPGETINIYKDIDGYKVVSHYDWMPGYNVSHQIVSEYFGFANGSHYMFLDYEKLDPTPAPGQDQKDPGKDKDKENPTPAPGQDQKDPGKQLPNTGEKESTFEVLAGLLAAGLAWFTLRKKQ